MTSTKRIEELNKTIRKGEWFLLVTVSILFFVVGILCMTVGIGFLIQDPFSFGGLLGIVFLFIGIVSLTKSLGSGFKEVYHRFLKGEMAK